MQHDDTATGGGHDRAGLPVVAAIDFDGVVNALPRGEADLSHFHRWQQTQVAGFTLTVAGEVVDWLTTLPARGAEFHWATTWTPNRDLLEEAFGLPADAPVAADPDRRNRRDQLHVGPRTTDLAMNWKATQILELLEAQRRPLLWLDDSAITDTAVQALTQFADRCGLSVLAVQSAPVTGLRPDEMALADDFLERVRAGTAPPGVSVHRAAGSR